jgi:protein SCO1/2
MNPLFGMRRGAAAVVLIVATQACLICAHGLHGHAAHTPGPGADSGIVDDDSGVVSGTMGIDEKLGNFVPLDIPFVTEANDSVRLKDVIKGPTILSILYYKCPNACNMLLSSIAAVLRSYAGKPSAAPNVVSVSVDDKETPADAMKAKAMAFEAIQWQYPKDRWRFLTGSAASIKSVTDAVGYHFVKKGDEFDHPLGLVILSPKGKVVRYITGTDYLPVDIGMSLMEAANGLAQPTIARVLRACFSYDPKSHRFVFNILKVSATVILTLLGAFVLFLVFSRRRPPLRKGIPHGRT